MLTWNPWVQAEDMDGVTFAITRSTSDLDGVGHWMVTKGVGFSTLIPRQKHVHPEMQIELCSHQPTAIAKAMQQMCVFVWKACLY